jgi:peptidoglycan/xylan/chitin deacetylase (PgdA/CDA1 family)
LPLRVKLRAIFIFTISLSILLFLFYLSYLNRFFLLILIPLLIISFILLYLFVPQIRVPGEVKIGKKGKVYLTFDDGPSEKWTSKILDILKEKDVKATFFVVGEKAKRCPDIVKRIVEEEHGIGNHTYTHRKLTFLSYKDVFNEIERCEEEIFRITGKRPYLLRTPHGFRSLFLPLIKRKKGLKVVTWTKGVWDTDGPGEKEIMMRVFKKVKNGEILLLHDGNEKAAPQVFSCLSEIIDEYKKRGFGFGKVEEI